MEYPPHTDRPEFDLIDWINGQSSSSHGLRLGIGDDAAVLQSTSGQEWVTAVDCLVEGVHFLQSTPLEQVGRKSLAVNLSDLAAMGAVPVTALIGLVLPKSMGRSDVERLCRGLFEFAREWDVSIAGGDTNSSDGPLMISVTILGQMPEGREVRRSGASADDLLFVTGQLGGSFESGRHLTFEPRLREAWELVSLYSPTSMMDISDGLDGDLFHLARQSQVGFVINAESIPIHPDVSLTLSPSERLQHAISDGEDFELLFTLSEEASARMIQTGQLGSTPVTCIGRCRRERTIAVVQHGVESPLLPSGWVHRFP